MKKMVLEILNCEGKTVRAYTTDYNETEGEKMRLTIDDNTYIMNTNGKLLILTQ